ncbi:MAG: coenzyme F420-0:L-glutamate ligase [Thermoprotei archaeon]|nr:MAG: coenzyme F420-0:L-glutamate ligase [Thermoprotei archaeon]
MAKKVLIYGLETVPKIEPGDDLAKIIVECAEKEGVGIEDGDIIVVSSKIVSKAEGRIVSLENVEVCEKAEELSEKTGKDPRLVQLILNESEELVKVKRGHIIVKTRHGIVCANAGIDRSNVAGREDIVVLLPTDPDKSAESIRESIMKLTGKTVAVIITDTYGRPLREGQIDMAIGLSGINPFKDYRGKKDWMGYTLKIKRIALADEIAAAAELVKGNGGEGIPVAIIRGLEYRVSENASARELNMIREKWLFR